MSRDVPYENNETCDNCGQKGAFDFMGDYYCQECLSTCPSCGEMFVIDLSLSKDMQRCYECRNAEHTMEPTRGSEINSAKEDNHDNQN